MGLFSRWDLKKLCTYCLHRWETTTTKMTTNYSSRRGTVFTTTNTVRNGGGGSHFSIEFHYTLHYKRVVVAKKNLFLAYLTRISLLSIITPPPAAISHGTKRFFFVRPYVIKKKKSWRDVRNQDFRIITLLIIILGRRVHKDDWENG
jgi:hypothetical protein